MGWWDGRAKLDRYASVCAVLPLRKNEAARCIYIQVVRFHRCFDLSLVQKNWKKMGMNRVIYYGLSEEMEELEGWTLLLKILISRMNSPKTDGSAFIWRFPFPYSRDGNHSHYFTPRAPHFSLLTLLVHSNIFTTHTHHTWCHNSITFSLLNHHSLCTSLVDYTTTND